MNEAVPVIDKTTNHATSCVAILIYGGHIVIWGFIVCRLGHIFTTGTRSTSDQIDYLVEAFTCLKKATCEIQICWRKNPSRQWNLNFEKT